MDKMPARIQQVVRDENLRFMKNKAIYDADYFHFLLNIAKSSMVGFRKNVLCTKLISLSKVHS